MKKSFCVKLISLLLVVATLMVSLPLSVFAETEDGNETTETAEVYMKSIKLAQARTKEEAKSLLEDAGYIFLDRNLNEGTGADGIWLGYTTTTDPNEAIYDIKLMNTEGGYTLTSMEAVLNSQKNSFAQMAADLNFLVEEFVEAYNADSVPAQKAYMALNFFRVVDGETELAEENGLGYQLVNGNMTDEKLTNMILFCDGTIFDSVVKLLTMGVQVRTENWMESLSKLGAYDSELSYGDDEAELKRRAKQLLVVLQLYAQTYNSMDKMGLVSGTFDEQGNIVNNGTVSSDGDGVTAQQADLVKIDMSRVKSYKLVFDELEKYGYGNGTLKDFFSSLEKEKDEKVLYPLVKVLTDGEFAALSYGCFIELALGANAKTSDFKDYDEAFKEITKDVKSLYLYAGVNPALLDEDSVIGFTDTASRHMALTGEYQFYEKESSGEDVWETGRYVALSIGATGMAVMAASKLTLGILSLTGMLSAATAEGATGVIAGLAKICAVTGSGYVTLIALAVAAVIAIVTYIIYVVDEDKRNSVDWEANPIPEYMYDVREVGFSETSKNDGIETSYIKKPTFVFYEAVLDVDGKAADLNARSEDASRWIALYVSHDRPGDDSKPVKANEFLMNTGNGETPEGYLPVSRFGEVRAYNLNQWDKKDDVNGIYLFYQQDQQVSVNSDRTYYIYEVQLQTGESSAHCISLLEAAGYIPLNVNLSPDYKSKSLSNSSVFTYLGYKITDNPNSAITDLRMEYGMAQGSVQFGGITYASCGNSAGVTLYATKYKAAGTPLLAAGLKCVNDQDDAPVGYEPVCFFAGGPAGSFNTTYEGVKVGTVDYYLYFLPETTFTGGKSYLGGAAYFYCDEIALTSAFSSFAYDANIRETVLAYLKKKNGVDYPTDTTDKIKKAMNDYAFLRSGYHYSSENFSGSGSSIYSDSVLYYITYNPYRAVYNVKGTALAEISNHLTFESQGYTEWNTVWWSGTRYVLHDGIYYGFGFSYNGQGKDTPLNMTSSLYFAGNPSKTNLYDAGTKKMTETQPLGIDDLVCLDKSADNSWVLGEDSVYIPVSDIFTASKDPITVKNGTSGENKEYIFYVVGTDEERPYVSAITSVDRLSLFRAAGGVDAGLSRSDITVNMLLAQLAKQGATHFAEIEAATYRKIYALNVYIDPTGATYNEMNTTKFGYTKTAEASDALRDVFIYVSGFSDDEPPSELYRGKVKYTLLCELSGNLTGYEEAPQPGIYLYGTTDKKAGERIIDVEFSSTPFKEGYETVRTMNGRSMWAETIDYMTAQQNNHFMSGAEKLYDSLVKFFGFESNGVIYDVLRTEKYYYIHIKREGDSIRTQKPYISELYLSTRERNGTQMLAKIDILDTLFDQGAESYLELDLNYRNNGQQIYLGYSYTADPNDAITAIRPSHTGFWGESTTVGYGIRYYSVGQLNLNAGLKGDSIYLYYTKSHHEDAGTPITDIRYSINTVPKYTVTDDAELMPVMRWDSWNPSDLNAGTGKDAIYLTVVRPFERPDGTYKELNYGTDKVYTRKNVTGAAEGKYLAALYVMDKNTIRQEKLAQGIASEQCTCDKISDQEVFDRLKQMGATTILTTPISISDGEYKNNKNKVFIGYSRTDDCKKAIKNIAIHAEVLSLAEPDATIDIGKKTYTLVAEAASKVTALPRAINLLGTEDGQDLLIPKFYLYTSTVGETEPIYDICIDGEPLKNGWNTVLSSNRIEPFSDIYRQAKKQAELGDKDDDDSYDSELVYTDELYKWMDSVTDTFDPAEEEITPFYIHCKKIDGDSIKEAAPYICEIYIAAGDTKRDALAQLAAYEPDEYVDYDLNRSAGGDYIYLAYKRTSNKSEALTDLIVCYNGDVEHRQILVGKDKKIRYDRVSGVDLNKGTFGFDLYLYSTTKKDAGEPIKDLYVTNREVWKKENGFVTECTVRFAYDYYNVYQVMDVDPDLNDGAGGSYIYLNMKRSAPVADTVDADANNNSMSAGSIIGNGSVIALGALLGIGVLSALAVLYAKRKKKV